MDVICMDAIWMEKDVSTQPDPRVEEREASAAAVAPRLRMVLPNLAGSLPPEAPVSLAIALLTVSDSRSLAEDASGDALRQRLEAAGHRLAHRALVPDDRYRIRAEMSRWIADPAVQVVISSGGTGLTGRDGTPEAVEPLLDKTIEGFGELFRVLSYDTIGTSSLQSRCLAGVANGTVIFVLPGSLDAVCTAWDRLIRAQLDETTRPCNLVQLLPRLRERP